MPPWVVDSPNHGFRLVEGDELVGVHLAFYSRRLINGTVEDFCNLGAWCVLEPHRSHGIGCSAPCSPSRATASPTSPPVAPWSR